MVHFDFRAVPKVGEDFPPGINCSEELSMLVEFHSIVPLDVWEWDHNSNIYMRFGYSEFGDWEQDIGPGDLIRCCFSAVCGGYINIMRDLSMYFKTYLSLLMQVHSAKTIVLCFIYINCLFKP